MAHMTNTASIQPRPIRPVNQRVGRNVRDIMFAREKNQVELALAIGVTESSMSRRIKGTTDWAPDEMEIVASLLNVKVSRLFEMLPDLDLNQEPTGSRLAPVSSLTERIMPSVERDTLATVTRISA